MMERHYPFTDDEVIKALEHHADRNCEGCPLEHCHDCCQAVIDNAVGLLYRQKAEIERLKEFEFMYKELCE